MQYCLYMLKRWIRDAAELKGGTVEGRRITFPSVGQALGFGIILDAGKIPNVFRTGARSGFLVSPVCPSRDGGAADACSFENQLCVFCGGKDVAGED